MITGIFHQGSGLGNQLHRYVATRALAMDKKWDFGMLNHENFKGAAFMPLDFGDDAYTSIYIKEWNERKIVNEHGDDVREYDPMIKYVGKFTIIDGEFQDPKYFEHHLDEIQAWLPVEPIEMPDNVCVINFRGGEYVGVPGLFLPKAYWDKAILEIMQLKREVIFEVHTDDPVTAQRFFPTFKIIHDMEINWRSIRYAKYLILSNSSFAILPALLNRNVEKIIAPLYWAGYNKGYWQLPQNQYKQFTYIHHEGDTM